MTKHFLLKTVLLSAVVVAAVFSFRNNDGALTSNKFVSSSSMETFPAEVTQPVVTQPVVTEPETPAPPRIQIINHIVQAGETLTSLWESYGTSARHAVKVMDTLKDRGLARIGLKKGESVKVAYSSDGGLLNFEKRLDDGRTVLVSRHDNGDGVDEDFDAEIVPAEIVETERTVSGTIKDSLAASAQSMGVSYSLVDDVVDLFSSRIHFDKDIQPGDSFAVTLKEKHSKRDGMLIGDPTITEASFIIGGKLMAVFGQEGTDKKIHFMDESGSMMGNYFLRYPLNFTRISSTFTYARFHPILQRNRPHLGVDFAAPIGTPVRSVGDGTILDIGFKTEPGNWIKIEHTDRWSTAYMHLSSFAPGLKVGSKVSRGQLIGAVGQTGLATGPHLHFSLYDNGTYVNPLTTDLPQMDSDVVKMPKMLLVQRLDAIRALHEKTRMLASNKTLDPTKRQL